MVNFEWQYTCEEEGEVNRGQQGWEWKRKTISRIIRDGCRLYQAAVHPCRSGGRQGGGQGREVRGAGRSLVVKRLLHVLSQTCTVCTLWTVVTLWGSQPVGRVEKCSASIGRRCKGQTNSRPIIVKLGREDEGVGRLHTEAEVKEDGGGEEEGEGPRGDGQPERVGL